MWAQGNVSKGAKRRCKGHERRSKLPAAGKWISTHELTFGFMSNYKNEQCCDYSYRISSQPQCHAAIVPNTQNRLHHIAIESMKSYSGLVLDVASGMNTVPR